MDVIVQRQGALDVHEEQVTACVRVPDEQGKRISPVVEFKTTVRGLLVLRLAEGPPGHAGHDGGDRRVLKPVWHVLEDEFELVLVSARHVKQVRARARTGACTCVVLSRQKIPRIGERAHVQPAGRSALETRFMRTGAPGEGLPCWLAR